MASCTRSRKAMCRFTSDADTESASSVVMFVPIFLGKWLFLEKLRVHGILDFLHPTRLQKRRKRPEDSKSVDLNQEDFRKILVVATSRFEATSQATSRFD